MKSLVFVVLLFNCTACAAADTTAVNKQPVSGGLASLKQADEAFEGRNYLTALNLYNSSLAADTANPNLNFKVALCHLYLRHQPKLNIQLLKTAINNFNIRYDFFNDKLTQSSVDAFYFLGKSFIYNGQIDSAMQYLVYYQNFLHNNLPMDAGRQMKMCINARHLMKTPRQINIHELGAPVNTGFDESHPVLSLDNKVLFFASRKPSKNMQEGQLADDDIYFSAIDSINGTYGAPQAFPFNTEFDEEPVFMSANGNTLYFRRGDKKGSGDIYYSEKTDEKWGEPKKVKGVNTPYDEQGLSISNDGTMMIVSSNRPGGVGGYDLYIAEGKNGNWGALKNMGNTVNTSLDEISPFVFPGSRRVYFSTNGNSEYGMGGFDIFFTQPDSVGKKWNQPFTLGYPVNTSGNEFDYTLGAQGKTIYTAVGKNGDLDLFDITAGEFKPEIQDQITEVVGTSETQTVAVVEVEREKKVEVEKDVEVAKVEEVEKDVEKNVGYVNIDEAKKLDKVVAVQKEEVEVQSVVETEKLVYTNKPQQAIDSLNGVSPLEGNADAWKQNGGPEKFEVTSNVPMPASNNQLTGNETKVGDKQPESPANNGVAQKQDEVPGQNLKAEESKESEIDGPTEKILARMSKSEREALIKKIKDDLATEMNKNRSAVFKTFYFGFNNDSAILENYEMKILVDFLKEHKNVNIEVVGHTDNIGKWETNFWISRQRAKSVYDYLADHKIATNRMIFNGKGGIEPIAPNTTAAGRAQNRRVEIVLIQ